MIGKSAVLDILMCAFILLFAAACNIESKDPIISESAGMGEVDASTAEGTNEPSTEESAYSDEGGSASLLDDELLNLEAEEGWSWNNIQGEIRGRNRKGVACIIMIPEGWQVDSNHISRLWYGVFSGYIRLIAVNEADESYMHYKEKIALLEQIVVGNRTLYFENLGAGPPGRNENDSLSPYLYYYYFEESGYLFICNFLWQGKRDTQQMEIFEKVVSSLTIKE